MKRLQVLLLFSFLFQTAFSQIVETVPPFPTEDQSLSIVFDASLGSGGLEDYNGTVYAHTGVITDRSSSPTDWRYVKTDWGENTPETRLTQIGDNQYRLEITPTIRSYYQVPSNEEILKVAFVFRSAQPVGGSYLEGKAEDFSDIYVDLFNNDDGFLYKIARPVNNNLIIDEGNYFIFEGFTSQNADMNLYDNGNLLASTSNSKRLYDTVYAVELGNHDLLFEIIDSAGNYYSEKRRYVVPSFPPVQALPGDIHLGIQELDKDSIRFTLEAPGKQEVWLIGSLTNWLIDTERFQMNRTPGGKYFWLDVNIQNTDSFITYQYLVDRELYIADPLAEVILDPAQDAFLDGIWQGLPSYPEEASQMVTLYDPNEFGYVFENAAVVPEDDQMVVYELLIRDFLDDHSFAGLMDTLDYLDKLGVNTIELMPINEFEGNISWGYNPSFHGAVDKYYGRPEALKAFIDEAHSRGMIVILDVVYNHAFSQSSHCRMYWDADNFQPAVNNPWLNQTAKHPFNVGYDYNHEYEGTQRFVKETVRRWLEEYRFDGFRFDLSKGFTQRFTNDVGQWGNYDANRIARLKDYAQFIWQINPEAKVILEHFAENTEERELSEFGMLLWNNMHYAYNEASMGYNSGGNSNFSNAYFRQRGFNEPHLITYMESHDEERMMYRNLEFGNSSANYDTRDFGTALDRMELASVFFYSIPGPVMLWQFGELGYEFSINRCPNGTINNSCRTSPKPIRWDYLDNMQRQDLQAKVQDMIFLKTQTDLFRSSVNVAMDLNSAVKRMRIGDSVNIIGNFDLVERIVQTDLRMPGIWYDYFSGDSIFSTDGMYTDTLQAGEYRLFIKKKIDRPSQDMSTSINDIVLDQNLTIYPNPSRDQLNIRLTGPLLSENKDVWIMDPQGKVLFQQRWNEYMGWRSIDISSLPMGTHTLVIMGDQHYGVQKFIKIE